MSPGPLAWPSRTDSYFDKRVVLGGAGTKWDWEEELIDTKCQQCQHEWHGWHKRVTETSE